jgi:hypothetical protein
MLMPIASATKSFDWERLFAAVTVFGLVVHETNVIKSRRGATGEAEPSTAPTQADAT